MVIPEWSNIDIIDYNNAGYLVGLNDANGWNPGKYSRVDWFPGADDTVLYCTTLFQAETLEATHALGLAGSVPTDVLDPSLAETSTGSDTGKGCGGFGFTVLTAKQAPSFMKYCSSF